MGSVDSTHRHLALGWQAVQRGDLRSAENIAGEILRRNAQDADALQLLGTALLLQGRFQDATGPLKEVLRRVRVAGVGSQLGHCYLAVGDAESAIAALTREIEAFPDQIDAHNLLGVALAQAGRHPEAIAVLERAIERWPGVAGTHSNLGSVLSQLGRHEEAIAQFAKAAGLDPGFRQAHDNLASAHANLGNALADAGRYQEAAASYRAAIAAAPGQAPLYNSLGTALGELGRYPEAVDAFHAALARDPASADAHSNLGFVYDKQGRLDEAIASYGRALSVDPKFAKTHTLLGTAYRKQGRLPEAIEAHKRALSIDPDLAEAHTNLGVVHQFEKRFEDAIACHRKAIALKPALAEAHANLGAACQELQRLDEAAACYRAALSLNPRYADAHHNLGALLRDRGDYPAAVECFKQALALNPDHERALSSLAWSELSGCVWTNLRERSDALRKAVDARRWVDPFLLLALSHDADEQRRCAERYAVDYASPPTPRDRARPAHERIRIAYLSSDYRTHPAAFLLAPLFESHDRSKFETIGVSYGPDDGSDIRTRVQRGFDRFADVRSMGDAEVASLLLEMEVDIAIDLNGYTKYSRPRILARRPAPVQVSYLGYTGTMGAGFIDYILADRFVVPPEHEVFYTEKVVRLPDCYWIDNAERTIAGRAGSRSEQGLPQDGVVFCCFNNNYKIAPPLFDVWMRLLARVPGSVLWLLQDNAWAEENLRKEARSRGIDPSRLIFAPRMKRDDHLARHGLADLFLDTLPYNAHTTASDALWMGVPVVTCVGDTFPGRVAGSLLHAAGLPELVTSGLEAYEHLALEIATDPGRLREIRAKLARAGRASPVFDTERFRRQVESAYTTMWETWARGQPPRSFAVSAGT
jgi:predicted O-linked N-acetylglucosamine transferase (SPINDLY family)